MQKNLTEYRVIYGDTDQMGVVYYANYLRCFEKGRTEFLRQLGAPYTSVEKKGLYFPVTEVSCHYHRPARFDDLIIIETTLTSLGRASLTFSYELYRQEGKERIAAGWTKHACVDEKGNVTKTPANLGTTLKAALSPPIKPGAD